MQSGNLNTHSNSEINLLTPRISKKLGDAIRTLKGAMKIDCNTRSVQWAMNNLVNEIIQVVQPFALIINSSEPEKTINPRSTHIAKRSGTSTRDSSVDTMKIQPTTTSASVPFLQAFKSSSPVQIVRRPRISNRARAAKVVFGVPELLQIVLLFLDFESILKLQQVSRSMKNAIDSSMLVQRKMALSPDPYFQNPFENHRFMPGFFHSVISETKSPKSEVAFKVVVKMSPNVSIKIGSRCSRMLVLQPPLYKMTIHAYCCGQCATETGRVRTPYLKFVDNQGIVQNPRGVTVGDIFLAYENLKGSHQFCPKAHIDVHNLDGTVQVVAAFHGEITLRDDDPLLQKLRNEQCEVKKRNEFFAAKERHLIMYIAAKAFAFRNGLQIPTPAEYEATNPIIVDESDKQ